MGDYCYQQRKFNNKKNKNKQNVLEAGTELKATQSLWIKLIQVTSETG